MEKQVFYAIVLLSISWCPNGTLSASQLAIEASERLTLRSLGTAGLGALGSTANRFLSEIRGDCYDESPFLKYLRKGGLFFRRASILPGFVGAINCLRLVFREKVSQDERNRLMSLGLVGLTFSSAFLCDEWTSQMKKKEDSHKEMKPQKEFIKMFKKHPFAYFGGGAVLFALGYLGALSGKCSISVKGFLPRRLISMKNLF
jgi:hypothetical protein